MNLQIKVEKYMDVVNGKMARKDWIESCFAGDMYEAVMFVKRLFEKGVKLPCGDVLPYPKEG